MLRNGPNARPVGLCLHLPHPATPAKIDERHPAERDGKCVLLPNQARLYTMNR